MKTNYFVSTTLLILLLSICVIHVHSQNFPSPPPQLQPPAFPPPHALADLDLDKETLTELADLEFTFRKKLISLNSKIQHAELTLDHAMRSDKKNDAMKAVDEINKARGELFKADIAARIKIREILGEENLAKLHIFQHTLNHKPHKRFLCPNNENQNSMRQADKP